MNKLSFFKWILSISLCLMLFFCTNTNKKTLPDPEIKDGIAKVSGKIPNFYPTGSKDTLSLMLIVPQPVGGDSYSKITPVNADGFFSFEVPMQCDYAVGYIRPEKYYSNEGFNVCLTSGKETKMEIIYEKNIQFKVTNQTDSFGLTSTDLININPFREKLMNESTPGITGYARTPDEFVQQARISLNYKLKMIAKNDNLSEIAKNYVANKMKILTLDLRLLMYKVMMQVDYLNAGNEDLKNFNIQEPDKKYYEFLKDFNLNNPQYLYDAYYSDVAQKILSNDTLNIPPVGDIPLDQWMIETKNIISKLVGFDKGLFYDLLAVNSYARQFDNELRPLSNKQIENINSYFKDEKTEIAKILLKKNEEIIQLAALKEPVVVNKTPVVPKEKVMDAIISKYKGKVAIVDFWATWCAPCLDAMTKYRAIKGELKGKDVVFVYFTNHSSPQKLWEEKIKGIGGEHYYLNDEEWMYLMDKFQFNGIPSYVIFDAKGAVRHQFTGYPGTEKMQAMIEDLLH